jgi:hypothetical protein
MVWLPVCGQQDRLICAGWHFGKNPFGQLLVVRVRLVRFQRGSVAYMEFNNLKGRPTANLHLRLGRSARMIRINPTRLMATALIVIL